MVSMPSVPKMATVLCVGARPATLVIHLFVATLTPAHRTLAAQMPTASPRVTELSVGVDRAMRVIHL